MAAFVALGTRIGSENQTPVYLPAHHEADLIALRLSPLDEGKDFLAGILSETECAATGASLVLGDSERADLGIDG